MAVLGPNPRASIGRRASSSTSRDRTLFSSSSDNIRRRSELHRNGILEGGHLRNAGTHSQHGSNLSWPIEWTSSRFQSGRVLIIDYVTTDATLSPRNADEDPNVMVQVHEFEEKSDLESFYDNDDHLNSAALRVVHVMNASWATGHLLRRYNIDHEDETIGMKGFSKWAKYEKPRLRQGKPFPTGKSWREQTDPWRNVSRTAFGVDYVKTYKTPERSSRRHYTASQKPVRAQMMHLDAWSDSTNPAGYDVSIQRLSTYVQRNLGPPKPIDSDQHTRNPYTRSQSNGEINPNDEGLLEFDRLDNTDTIIIFEFSASTALNDCLIQPRNEFESRWRRLPFLLKREDALDSHRLAVQCANMVLGDVFHGMAVIWQEFLSVGADHISILEDKIYENPADESRAPELWRNQAAWLKFEKIVLIHIDLVKEMQEHLYQVSEVEVDDRESLKVEWLAAIPAQYERLAHSVQEELVRPTSNLRNLMYKSVGIRDARLLTQLALSMWRLSWITFIFLPLTFIVGFFGMNVDIFEGGVSKPSDLPNIGYYFLAAAILMIFVLFLWYCIKHTLQRRRQAPYQRGLYERLFYDLEEQHPGLWSREGAEPVEPRGAVSKLKWRLLTYWFAPEKTIHKRLFGNVVGGDDGEAELGSWARMKRWLLLQWIETIDISHELDDMNQNPPAMNSNETDDQQSRSAPASVYTPTLDQLIEVSMGPSIAEGAPNAVQQISGTEQNPMGLQGQHGGSSRRPSSAPASRRRSLEDTTAQNGQGQNGVQVERAY